jgi:hypothetical protein
MAKQMTAKDKAERKRRKGWYDTKASVNKKAPKGMKLGEQAASILYDVGDKPGDVSDIVRKLAIRRKKKARKKKVTAK